MTRRTIKRTRGEQLSETVIDAVSEATDTDPRDLPRFSHTIDLDALDRLHRHAGGDQQSRTRVVFTVAGCEVEVTTDGRVVVIPSGSDERLAST